MTLEEALKLRTGEKKKIIITLHENLLKEVDKRIKSYPRTQYIEDALWYYYVKQILEENNERNVDV